jgi:NADPH:quinone reductase-like Zn-dependent oxidoreductase
MFNTYLPRSHNTGTCRNGCGNDCSGTVVSCPGCTRLKVGDRVWTMASGAFAEYVAHPEGHVGLRPQSLGAVEAGAVPEDGLTSLFSLKRTASEPKSALPAGSPWNKTNTCVKATCCTRVPTN